VAVLFGDGVKADHDEGALGERGANVKWRVQQALA
jgi:hypothetical protein